MLARRYRRSMRPSISHFSRALKIAASASLVACALFTRTSVALTDSLPLIERLARVEVEAATICPSVAQRQPLGQAIDDLAKELLTEKSLPASGDVAVQAVSDLLFKNLAIRPSLDLHDPCNLLP